jgi:hypothetical protein
MFNAVVVELFPTSMFIAAMKLLLEPQRVHQDASLRSPGAETIVKTTQNKPKL